VSKIEYYTNNTGRIIFDNIDEILILEDELISSILDSNLSDMRGILVVIGSDIKSLNIIEGDIGIVYNTYNDFDNNDGYGWSIMFENGGYDGFAISDRKLFDIKPIGIYPPTQHYKFINVTMLEVDYARGEFKFN
jgi:hypothetical protein